SHSSISRKWVLLSVFVSIGQMIIRAFSAVLPRKQRNYIRSLIGHRGITHSLVPVIVIPFMICLAGHIIGYADAGTYTAAGIGLGILSHLIFDMLAGGVPLFMPFSTKRICLAHIKTGGVAEWVFRVILILVFTYFGMEVISWQRLLQW
ncbi:MAG: metal-dependent hydrolase, partial [Lachnospiraceae bacterium]